MASAAAIPCARQFDLRVQGRHRQPAQTASVASVASVATVWVCTSDGVAVVSSVSLPRPNARPVAFHRAAAAAQSRSFREARFEPRCVAVKPRVVCSPDRRRRPLLRRALPLRCVRVGVFRQVWPPSQVVQGPAGVGPCIHNSSYVVGLVPLCVTYNCGYWRAIKVPRGTSCSHRGRRHG
eukprot:5543863-Lingulodinium_polyedra.AAC.1